MIGPILFTQTFATFIGAQRDWHLPGAPFLLSALLLASSLAVAWRVMATYLQSVPAPSPRAAD
jgi:DHA1 family tetracycline resistance protein-like MFS transporter